MTTMSPLTKIRVLDFSKVLAGPLCTQYLSDMGAEVIKVESITSGDDSRRWPPFPSAPDGDSLGTPFLAANRGKRSIALDLKSEQGRAICHKLAAWADVVVESFGPGVSERLSIDYDTLKNINPRLVYCSISGFGRNGPMKYHKGYDVILQAFTGMLSITGEPGGTSVRSPFSPVDQATGMHALIGILAALNDRHATGLGMKIDVSLFDTATGFLAYFLQGYWERGTEPEKPGSGHESLCPYEIFEASDKALILGVANDALWRKFCEMTDLSDYVNDPRFATNGSRVKHRAETVALVKKVIQRQTCDYWVERLDAAGIPCSPLNTLADLSNHPHSAESEMIREYTHPVLGSVKTVSQPIRFSGNRMPIRSPAPMLGEHSQQILSEIGLSAVEIDELTKQRIVHAWIAPSSDSQDQNKEGATS